MGCDIQIKTRICCIFQKYYLDMWGFSQLQVDLETDKNWLKFSLRVGSVYMEDFRPGSKGSKGCNFEITPDFIL